MKTIKNKIISNITTLTPFAFTSKRLNENWLDEDGKSTKTTNLRTIVNSFLSCASVVIPFMYYLIASDMGDINYKNWPRINEERTIEKEQRLERQIISDFYKADSDSSGLLDPKEFYDFMREE